MKIIFADTSHGIPEHDRFCSATFIGVGDDWYIVDAGAPISQLILRYGIRHDQVKGIFVTHLHPDHFEGLPEFCTQITWYYKNADPDIYLPGQHGVDLLRHWVRTVEPRYGEHLKLHVYENGLVFCDSSIEVKAVSTRHTDASHAFRIRAEGKHLLFTGDMCGSYPEFPEVLGGEHYDLVVCESAHNTGLVNCVPTLMQADTERMVINHINLVKLEGIEAVQDDFPFEFTLAYDGFTLEL